MTVTNTVPPAVTGTARQGQTLTTDEGTWTYDLDSLAYAYRWLRCDAAGANCSAISGQTSTSYTLQGADVGSTIRSEVTATEQSSTVTAHFDSDWSTGKIGWRPWATIFSYTPPSYQDVGLYGSPARQSSADGRVSVVANPYGAGNVLRCEIRDSDPFPTSLAKAEIGSYKTMTWPDGSFSQGRELWIRKELYLPNDFSMASGGANPFTVLGDLHPNSNSGIPALNLGGYSTTNVQLSVGLSPNTQRLDFIPINSGNRNRKLEILIGMKVAVSGGWVEAWLDGVNVIPRLSKAMAESSEVGPYWKEGLYTSSDASFVGGRSIVYHGRTIIGQTKASVGA